MDSSLIYWITRLDYINGACCGIAFLAGAAAAFLTMFFWIENRTLSPDIASKVAKRSKTLTVLCFVFIVAKVLVPTTKEMAAIYMIPKVVNNEDVQTIGDNGLKILRQHTADYLNQLTGKDKSKE